MSRCKTKEVLMADVQKERALLDELLLAIPAKEKALVVVDGMSVKDFLVHRTEWGRMMLSWYKTAKSGKTPAVPSEKYKWNQLKELNAEIFAKYKNVSLKQAETDFAKVHDELWQVIKKIPEHDLLTKHVYDFTGSSDLATYFNSATAVHYHSARKHIQKWWKSQSR
jgi:hypothetical protein